MATIGRRGFLTGASASLFIGTTPALALPQAIDWVQVRKAARSLDLIRQGKVVKSYRIWLGAQPQGPKRFQGDMRTPEGTYRINCRNPASSFFLSLGVSYPDARDISYAKQNGRAPGGDIFIHGQPNGTAVTFNYDWTRGCIAVSNDDMQELWGLIPVGCPIAIYA